MSAIATTGDYMGLCMQPQGLTLVISPLIALMRDQVRDSTVPFEIAFLSLSPNI